MTKKISVGIVVLLSLMLVGCATTSVVPQKAVCNRIPLADIPQMDNKIPPPKQLVPGKPYTPNISSVAMSRSNWTLMELYNKSLKLWADSAKEAVDKHNHSTDGVIEEVKKEELPWYRRVF